MNPNDILINLNLNRLKQQRDPLNSSAQEQLISHLKAQLAKQQLCLNDKNKEIIEAERQCNATKVSYVQLQEELLLKDTAINALSNQHSKLKLSNATLKAENEELMKQHQASNALLIELKQKISSIDHLTQFQHQIESIKPSPNQPLKEKEYLIEISKLMNRVNELEIEKAQLAFESKVLQMRLDQTTSDCTNEIEMNKRFHDKTISTYKKTLSDMKTQIINLTQRESTQQRLFTEESAGRQSLTTQSLLFQLNEMEAKAKAYEADNYLLTKKVRHCEDEIGEYKIYLANKDNLIEKLQKEGELQSAECKQRVNVLEEEAQLIRTETSETKLRNEELIEQVNALVVRNSELEGGFEKMSNSIKATNSLVCEKIAVYEEELRKEVKRNQVYKRKIVSLKRKVEELNCCLEKNKWSIDLKKGGELKEGTEEAIKHEHLNTISTVQVTDPYESSQRKSIEDYKDVLMKIEANLFRSKRGYIDCN